MHGTDEGEWFDGRVLQTLPLRLIQGSSPPEACQQRQQRFARVAHSSCGAHDPDDETHQSFALKDLHHAAPHRSVKVCSSQSPTLMPRSGSGKAAGGGLTRDPIALKVKVIEALGKS